MPKRGIFGFDRRAIRRINKADVDLEINFEPEMAIDGPNYLDPELPAERNFVENNITGPAANRVDTSRPKALVLTSFMRSGMPVHRSMFTDLVRRCNYFYLLFLHCLT